MNVRYASRCVEMGEHAQISKKWGMPSKPRELTDSQMKIKPPGELIKPDKIMIMIASGREDEDRTDATQCDHS